MFWSLAASQLLRQMRFHLPICTFILFCISHKPPQASLKSFLAKLDFSLFPPQHFWRLRHPFISLRRSKMHIKTKEMGVKKKKQPLALLSADGTVGYHLHCGSSTLFIEDLKLFVFPHLGFPKAAHATKRAPLTSLKSTNGEYEACSPFALLGSVRKKSL